MALIESLLTAMVRADGDALVMHVGERPSVVVGAGTLDLSTQILNLDAMTGMLHQLLPAAAQDSLEKCGVVEHRLPAHEGDRFTVVAARGGDDIWIEIRCRRHAARVAAPAAVPPPPAVAVAETVAPAPPVAVGIAVPADVAPPFEVPLLRRRSWSKPRCLKTNSECSTNCRRSRIGTSVVERLA